MTCTANASGSFFYSTLAADPELIELVVLFVDELPERLSLMEASWGAGDSSRLARTAHQLKGAAGSYGFPELTPPLIQLEQLARQGQDFSAMREALDTVTGLCSRIRAGSPA